MKKTIASFLIIGMFVVSSCASTGSTDSETTDTTSVAPTETPAMESMPADTTTMPMDTTGSN